MGFKNKGYLADPRFVKSQIQYLTMNWKNEKPYVNYCKVEMTVKKSIVTIKWGVEFTSEDVNILSRAVKNNCESSFQFVCLTDNTSGLDDDIVVSPIPMAGLSQMPKSTGAWPKICLFHPSLGDLFDQALFLDIDTVICGNIDPFLKDPGDALRLLSCGPRWKRFNSELPPQPATGIMSYKVSRHVNIFIDFAKDPNAAYGEYDIEQEFVGNIATKIDYFDLEYVQSFKYHLRRQYLVDLFLPPQAPHEKARMVAFHGYPRPRQVAMVGKKWARFPRTGINRPAWLTDYWNHYSDKSV